MPRQRKKSGPSNVPCQYDCGRMAEGTLMVSYNTWSDEDDYNFRRGFNANIPCCRVCLRKALTLEVAIPKVKQS